MSASAARLAQRAASKVVVGMADMKVCADPDAVLVTYALGSCIAVLAWDPEARVGGMLHFMLPLSKKHPKKASTHPFMFADTGVPHMFKLLYGMGATKKGLVVKVTGGANVLDDKGLFQIGKRNHAVVRKMFWQNGILIAAQDVGGCSSRTATLHVGTGEAAIFSNNVEVPL